MLFARWSRHGVAGLVGAAAVVLPLLGPSVPARAQTVFTVGLPTVVDPVRGVGEPDVIVDNHNNALITGPGGSSTQTSFFWKSHDGGLTYSLLGPSQGHWVCPASGGGDSLAVYDRTNGDTYLTDQEGLADIGSAKIDGATGATTSGCATAPGLTADRPFEGILDSTTAPQSNADPGKQIVYLSWLCAGCTGIGTGGPTVGGLAFGWSDDGVSFHAADPSVIGDTPVTNTFQEGGTINSFSEHGPTVVDPRTGYVYTGISCAGSTAASPSGCPNGKTDNEVGIVIGAPQSTPDPANLGQFSKLTYQPAVTTDPDGAPMRESNSLFPVIAMDSDGTLYEAYIEGDGFATPTDPLTHETAWHLYYAYSTDAPLHKTWSKPIRVDTGAQTATTDFGWMAVGDPGKLGFVWLGTDRREHPSAKDSGTQREWHPFMAMTTDGLDAHPVFQQQRVGIGPNHINDMCLQGTVGCIQNVGNRNMADFISCDIGPDGALQAVWANDSNQLATLPTTLIPGLPLTETARQVSGPRLHGTGDLADARFRAAARGGLGDAVGDAEFPVDPGQGTQTHVPQLDLAGSRVEWVGNSLVVHADVEDLTSMSSPSVTQGNVWYLTTWQFDHKIYFARAESDLGGALTFAAGPAKSFDRVGLNAQTVATLVDYSGGTAVQGSMSGNEIAITVPADLVGNPTSASLLETVTSYTALDNGLPLFVGPATGNIPTIIDATAAYDTVLGSITGITGVIGTVSGSTSGSAGGGSVSTPNTRGAGGSAGSAAVLAVLLLAGTSFRARRRRRA
jgi:hypothetical protein